LPMFDLELSQYKCMFTPKRLKYKLLGVLEKVNR
jgi:hypothetical protein